MTVKAVRMGALALAAPFAMSATFPSPYTASFDVVPMIRCSGGLGSGVRVSDDTVISVNHVTSLGGCSIDGAPVITSHVAKPDFSAVTGILPSGFRAIVSCEGILPGAAYLAIGYAAGGKGVVEPLIGTDQRSGGMTLLKGKVFRGMSGGAVVNQMGAVVAVINALGIDNPYAFVTPLSETYLCRASALQ